MFTFLSRAILTLKASKTLDLGYCTQLSICLSSCSVCQHTYTVWHTSLPYKQYFYRLTESAYSWQPNFPWSHEINFLPGLTFLHFTVMGLPCHFDPFENTIYHLLNHSDLVGGAQFHCKNICGLITIPPNLNPQQLKACLQDGKDAGRQPETNLKFLLKWEMQADEIPASSIIAINHDWGIYLCLF